MQVSVEKISELSRKMTVNFPVEMIQEKMESRFKSLTREVNIKGFRPGKVPIRVVKQMYSDRVRSEVTGEIIQKSYSDAIKEQNLDPVGEPHIHPTDDATEFKYTAEFEVYPEISLDILPSLKITQAVATIEQDDQDKILEKIREQKKNWQIVKRPAQTNDRITINLSEVSQDKKLAKNIFKDQAIYLDSEQNIYGFENQLKGLKAGQTKKIKMTVPDGQDNDKKLLGEEVEIEVTKVEESSLPELDQAFIKSYGIKDGTLASFKTYIKSNMEKELERGIKNKLKISVLDSLYEKIVISAPKVLIDQEIHNLKKSYEENLKKQHITPEEVDLENSAFENQANRRVKLGLILTAIIQQKEIKLNDTLLRTTIEEMANSYEEKKEIIEWYYSDEVRLNGIKQMVLEEQTIDWIIKQAQVQDQKVSFTDIIKTSH